jgi:hypothetical protein
MNVCAKQHKIKWKVDLNNVFLTRQNAKKGVNLPDKMRVTKLILIAAIGLSSTIKAQILPSFGDSRSGSTGMQFLKIAPDARSMSLGGAFVATTNDVSAMFWNPAGIAQTDTGKANIQLSHTRYFGNSSANFVGAVTKLGQHSFVGLQVFSMDYGKMEETTEFESQGTGRQFGINNYYVGLTYAQILTQSFSFGINARYANEGFPGVSIHNVLFDLGLKYNVGVKNTRFGVSFSNFGFNVNPEGNAQVLKFDGPTDISSFTTVTVPGMFRIGAAFDPLMGKTHNITVSAQLNHPTDNNETYGFGAEYSYKRFAYGRLGYEFGSDERYIAPAAGFGLKLQRNFGGLNLDYAFLAKERLGSLHRISLGINIR